MLQSVLVANRGEIAVRVLGTCRRLGLRTVAVYSDADALALHVQMADASVRLGPAPAAHSYLNAEAILRAARDTGAEAIHPGYGFLAENAGFAEQVQAAGLVWIGPSPAAMRALGDKARARALAEREGVPILDGYHGVDQAPATLAREAARLGFPLLIKASAGGGGRGMRLVESASELDTQLQAAAREAQASFGDARVLFERYLPRPRHIEVQLLGDTHGRVVSLGERECSIQRRHQKLIEESPSPAVDADLRQRISQAALTLARAAGYSNAGTVEFLLDERGAFAFLEVNARLQVEHPVTEAVTGLDLVELQLRVASGEPLPFAIDQVEVHGHAIEARVIAEDPLAGWLPSTGTVEHFSVPDGVRVDTGLTDAARVPPEYDSLLAKVISTGATRAEALDRLLQALARTRLWGIAHNLDVLLACLSEPSFRAGDLDTHFLDRNGVLEHLAQVPGPVLAAACAADVFDRTPPDDPWKSRRAWRLGEVDQPRVWLRAGRAHTALVTRDLADPSYAHFGDWSARQVGAHRFELRGPAQRSIARVEDVEDGLRVVEYGGRLFRLTRPRPLSTQGVRWPLGGARSGGHGELRAPMPGRIVKVSVEAGQQVEQGQPLVVLEAMKMEHVVEAPHAGRVAEPGVQVGQQVAAGERLLTLEPA